MLFGQSLIGMQVAKTLPDLGIPAVHAANWKPDTSIDKYLTVVWEYEPDVMVGIVEAQAGDALQSVAYGDRQLQGLVQVLRGSTMAAADWSVLARIAGARLILVTNPSVF